jgi:hypothetical protein
MGRFQYAALMVSSAENGFASSRNYGRPRSDRYRLIRGEATDSLQADHPARERVEILQETGRRIVAPNWPGEKRVSEQVA